MPAVSADTLTLPRVSAPGPADTERPVRSITTGPHGYEGEGFPVVRAFAGVSTAALDPFVHMDQMGEVEYLPGEPRGTDWHPHRGFETVTYMIDGRFAHQDSLEDFQDGKFGSVPPNALMPHNPSRRRPIA